jgi:hypothetical protein
MKFIVILLLACACSGYRFTQQDNPLAQYGVKTLSVPMFYNYSNFSEVSGHFTKEVFRLLTGYSGLKLKSGYHQDTDAVLIGIIKSPEKMMDSLAPGNLRVAQLRASEAIGEKRQNFYIPGTSEIRLSLQVILIKKPTDEELTLLRSGLSDKVRLTSKIIFNETLPLKSQFTREVFDKNEGVEVTGTQNGGIQRKVVRGLAEQAALSVRDMILYAF